VPVTRRRIQSPGTVTVARSRCIRNRRRGIVRPSRVQARPAGVRVRVRDLIGLPGLSLWPNTFESLFWEGMRGTHWTARLWLGWTVLLSFQRLTYSTPIVSSRNAHLFPAVILCNRILPTLSANSKEPGSIPSFPCSTGASCEQTMVQSAIFGLQPESLWRNFQLLATIPRPSKKEQQVLSMLRQFADDRSLSWKQDSVGNLVIYRQGSGGGESARPILIQGHVDMVCAKNPAVSHNFFTDPIKLIRDGDWLRADGTTLGADNGIGVAASLALLELPLTAKLPPLECLFTVDEETGLTGAYSFDASLVHPPSQARAIELFATRTRTHILR
jgi:hypothetical protein